VTAKQLIIINRKVRLRLDTLTKLVQCTRNFGVSYQQQKPNSTDAKSNSVLAPVNCYVSVYFDDAAAHLVCRRRCRK
jgi:hypothetical protein